MLNNLLPPQSANHRPFIDMDAVDGAIIILALFTLNFFAPRLATP